MFNRTKATMKKLSVALAASALFATGSAHADLDYLSNTGFGATNGWTATVQTFTSTIDQGLLGFSFMGASSAQSVYTFNLYDWSTSGDHTALFSSAQSWNAGLNSIDGINLSLLAGHVYAAEVNYGSMTSGGMLYGGDVYSGGNGFWSESGGGNQASYAYFPNLDTAFAVRYGTISPVPEPQTYAMMLAGLGLIGFIAYRRKSDASTMPMAA
jgi:hypothetical protein